LTISGPGTFTLKGSDTYLGGTTVSGNLNVASAASLPTTGPLAISTGGKVQFSTGIGTVTVNSLSISGTGALDITNNELIISYTPGSDPISSIAALIKSGYAGGKWNGPGIFSSTAASNRAYGIGYADGADGVAAGIGSGQIELKYTLLGDANLDGVVNGIDFNLLATNFNKAVSGWDKGDFNYDGKVNGIDFDLLAENFNQSAGGTAVQSTDLSALYSFAAANGFLSDLPEPTTATLVMFLACPALGSRRRRTIRPNYASDRDSCSNRSNFALSSLPSVRTPVQTSSAKG